MFLMSNRDMLAGAELSVLPVLGTVAYTLQINLIGGYCFYAANFQYTKYDTATIIDMCEKAADTQMLKVSKLAAEQLKCPKTYCTAAELSALNQSSASS